jgi:hypothetical protein
MKKLWNGRARAEYEYQQNQDRKTKKLLPAAGNEMGAYPPVILNFPNRSLIDALELWPEA